MDDRPSVPVEWKNAHTALIAVERVQASENVSDRFRARLDAAQRELRAALLREQDKEERSGFVIYQISTKHCAAVDAFLALLREQDKDGGQVKRCEKHGRQDCEDCYIEALPPCKCGPHFADNPLCSEYPMGEQG